MGGGPPSFSQDFSCPAILGSSTEGSQQSFVYRTFTVYGWLSQTIRLESWFVTPRLGPHPSQVKPRNPECTTHAGFNVQLGFGYFPFARHYSGNRNFFLFLGVLRCFTSPRSPHAGYEFTRVMTRCYPRRVSPFGHLRITACLQLSGAYRSLPRPSSPSDAKASTICS